VPSGLDVARPFVSRQEHFAVVGSTSDVVRGFLAAGEPEVCVAIADEQSAGRGRQGRSWWAPAGRALLLSLGFRPTWLVPERSWQLGATAALAMADAAEHVAGLAAGTIRLKWPNDLVVEADGEPGSAGYRKLAGVLGETSGLGTHRPTVIIGLGINADWAAGEFPPLLAPGMTSLREAAGGRTIDRRALLDAFLERLAGRIEALRAGGFDVAGWGGRELTTGRLVSLELPDGRHEVVRAIGVDPLTGALLVEDADPRGGARSVLSGEVRHVRLAASDRAAHRGAVAAGGV
jgi:BirA family biotin operon repressor/biotin-[acetyl-CoA-carboxylase] ligase